MSARQQLAAALAAEQTLFAPLCLDPLSARLASECGFHAGYLSGGALGYALAVSEALLTLTELADTARAVVQRSSLPLIVDGGVGFGDPVHVARTIWEIEATGAAAVEIEDQVAPKRVSHHRGVEHLVAPEVMEQKIEQAVAARRDPGFLIIARTGAVKNESFAAALARADRYRRAGADLIMLMPDTEEQWLQAPQRIDAPLATIAALDARRAQRWRELGWRLVIDPFTAQVAALAAVRAAYRRFQTDGVTGLDLAELFAGYRELPRLAGLESLFAIEDATTERD